MAQKTKKPYQSKINIVAGIMAALAVISDPQFGHMFIPAEYLPKVMLGCSGLLFVLRTFFSGTKIEWRRRNGTDI
jgi:hypothetical protein